MSRFECFILKRRMDHLYVVCLRGAVAYGCQPRNKSPFPLHIILAKESKKCTPKRISCTTQKNQTATFLFDSFLCAKSASMISAPPQKGRVAIEHMLNMIHVQRESQTHDMSCTIPSVTLKITHVFCLKLYL